MSIHKTIRDFAVNSSTNVSFTDVAKNLNSNGYRNSRGFPFSENPSRPRGVASIVAEAVRDALARGDQIGADIIYQKIGGKNGDAAIKW
jgi:hypothetical protein